MAESDIDVCNLPLDIRARLAELDLELSEGDITQKGFEKKRQKVLGPFAKQFPKAAATGGNPSKPSPKTAAQRKQHRRLTREDNRYHSEIRTEAVMQALAMQKKQSVIPLPSKRMSAAYSPRRRENVTEGNSRPALDHQESHEDLTEDEDTEEYHDAPQQPQHSSSDDDSVFDEDQSRRREAATSSAPPLPQSSGTGSLRAANHTTNNSTPGGRPNSESNPLSRPPPRELGMPNRASAIYANLTGQDLEAAGRAGKPTTGVDVLSNTKPTPITPQQVIQGYSRSDSPQSRVHQSTPPPASTSVTPVQPSSRHYANIPGRGEPSPGSALADVIQIAHARQGVQPPDLTSDTNTGRSQQYRHIQQSHISSVRVTSSGAITGLPTEDGRAQGKVSAKIQQLLNTLKRPKRRPLREFFVDEEDELEGTFLMQCME